MAFPLCRVAQRKWVFPKAVKQVVLADYLRVRMVLAAQHQILMTVCPWAKALLVWGYAFQLELAPVPEP